MPRPLVQDRRERILNAAESLVVARGFDAMSVASIAQDAGIGKGAVYLEFDSKHAILDALLQRGTSRMKSLVGEAIGAAPRLSDAYRASVRVLLDDALMTAAFLDDNDVLGRHVATITDGRYRERHRQVALWVSELQRRGDLSPAIDADGLSLALSSTTIGLLSAARLLGPLSATQLESAINAVVTMIQTLEES